jgi:hypothetical protein
MAADCTFRTGVKDWDAAGKSGCATFFCACRSGHFHRHGAGLGRWDCGPLPVRKIAVEAALQALGENAKIVSVQLNVAPAARAGL